MNQSLVHSKSQHYNSRPCSNDPFIYYPLQDSAIVRKKKDKVPVTKLVLPKRQPAKFENSKSQFSQNTLKQVIDCGNGSSQDVMQQLLMLAGDVESNPGPGIF